jgi:hypothetical protein
MVIGTDIIEDRRVLERRIALRRIISHHQLLDPIGVRVVTPANIWQFDY